MEKLKKYIPLHLTIILFSFTGAFSKAASSFYNKEGLLSHGLYLFLFLMFLNCAVYAISWQKVIVKFELNIAYANRSAYLIWSQVWAIVFFHESLTVSNIIGLIIILTGVITVVMHE